MAPATADLSDAFGSALRISTLAWHAFGARRSFFGPCATVRIGRAHRLVREAIAEPGAGRVLVVDAGGALDLAMLGDNLAAAAHDNGWSGIVINGAVRDVELMAPIAIGVRALGTTARRADQDSLDGERQVMVSFGGVVFRPGEWVYVDADAVTVAAEPLHLREPDAA